MKLSGDCIRAVYRLQGSEEEASAAAHDICLEQTVEFPEDLIPKADIREHIVGRVVEFVPADAGGFEATIEFPAEVAGTELTQLINVLFGNISIKPGYRLERFELPDRLTAAFRGPRFGREGLRKRLGVTARPLLSTAIKPMGLSVPELAELARKFALGGIDLIKDDHGLADQCFAPFEERTIRLAEAVAEANEQTGSRCAYLPNVTAPADQLVERARFARLAGAGGLLVSPGIVGLDAMRQLADDDRIDLPIMSHPSFCGTMTMPEHGGMSHFAFYGQLMRLAGADAVIFPNYGGRFSFSVDQCREIMSGTACHMGSIAASLPAPAGGMKLERVGELCEFYGREAVLLIGGDLHRHGNDLVKSCRQFATMVEREFG